ncbi:MAG: NADH-quinone oxidoreductase subunit NuoH [Magnetococcales bacterium]|nr:NADH-quinone oxidoreductase subunit NuoH [Magnetococcales bacterium]MBF0321904.1 NADH-quinone oxidoreductase subunit NuoH [Magnetococcales bacterium]
MAGFLEWIQLNGQDLFGVVWPLVWTVIKIAVLLAPLMFCVTYLTWAERRIIGAMQVRPGPNRVGIFGLLQPLADAVKLFVKETLIPTGADVPVFLLAPLITLGMALVAWAVVPFSAELILVDVNVGILYVLAISSLGVYGVLMSGWSSNSRYAFLGSMRAAAQMVSYEVSLGFTIIPVVMLAGSLSLKDIVASQGDVWNVIPLLPLFVIYFISAVAETNRAPFDMVEAEAELVSGFATDYSAMSYGMFFLGEYANMILVSTLGALMFLGGWLPPLGMLGFIPGIVWLMIKIGLLLFVFLWIRATFPRYRYDQLMRLGWKVFLPVSLFWVFLTGLVLHLTGQIPG